MQSRDCRAEPRDSGYLPPPRPAQLLPVHILDGEMLRRQFYFALAVHERCQQLRSLAEVVASEKRLLLTSARRGVVPYFWPGFTSCQSPPSTPGNNCVLVDILVDSMHSTLYCCSFFHLSVSPSVQFQVVVC